MIRLRSEDSAAMAEALAAVMTFARGAEVVPGNYPAVVASVEPSFRFGPLRLEHLSRDGLMIDGRDEEAAASYVLQQVGGLVRSDE